eukprot:SM000031S11597  [mRNA]  locus=s31:543741:544455:- [translate_table: standard]
MRKRDLAILLLAVFAVFFSLQHEGTFSFREAWYHPNDGATPITHSERLPAPIVADLNGDGRSEVLIATHAATIENPSRPSVTSHSETLAFSGKCLFFPTRFG